MKLFPDLSLTTAVSDICVAFLYKQLAQIAYIKGVKKTALTVLRSDFTGEQVSLQKKKQNHRPWPLGVLLTVSLTDCAGYRLRNQTTSCYFGGFSSFKKNFRIT